MITITMFRDFTSLLVAGFIFFAFFTLPAHASETSGTITSSYNLTKICQDEACDDYGNVNWKPSLNANTTGATAVSITDSGLTGHLWGDEIGWVDLSPTGAGVSIDATTGVLSGEAYSSVGGWINFSPTGESVVINSSGEFVGYAYVSGIGGGWMKFDCSSSATCIKTDWRPVGSRGSSGGSSGGGGGGGSSSGGGGYLIDRSNSATTTDDTATSTASSTVSQSGYVFTKFLTIGDKGADVFALQRILTTLGFYNYGEVTGYFGPITRSAVIAFQKTKGLVPYPGYVGPGTRAALNGLSLAYVPDEPVVIPSQTFTSFLTVGSEGAEVTALQQVLKNLGHFTYEYITGFFGSITKNAVIAYQKVKGLIPYPGYVGPGTRAALNAELSAAPVAPAVAQPVVVVPVTPEPEPEPVVIVVDPNAPVKFENHLTLGSSGPEVTALQQLLKKLGFFTDTEVNGYFGEATKSAVKAFQCSEDIQPCPGWVGPGTQAALNRAQSSLSN